MKREELRQAINNNTLCEYDGIKYYVYGASITHKKGRGVVERVILHDLKANSITDAEYDKVTLLEGEFVQDI